MLMDAECCSLAFSLSRPDGFVPMSCCSSSAKPAHMMGSFPVLITFFFCAGVCGRQKFSPLLISSWLSSPLKQLIPDFLIKYFNIV